MWMYIAPTPTPESQFEIKNNQSTPPSYIAYNPTEIPSSIQTTPPPRHPGSRVCHFRQSDRGCITSTPKSDDFSKKVEKTRKYERDSCIPGPKNGERPYLAPSVPSFLDPFLARFSATFCSPQPPWSLRLPLPNTTQPNLIYIFYFYIIQAQH